MSKNIFLRILEETDIEKIHDLAIEELLNSPAHKEYRDGGVYIEGVNILDRSKKRLENDDNNENDVVIEVPKISSQGETIDYLPSVAYAKAEADQKKKKVDLESIFKVKPPVSKSTPVEKVSEDIQIDEVEEPDNLEEVAKGFMTTETISQETYFADGDAFMEMFKPPVNQDESNPMVKAVNPVEQKKAPAEEDNQIPEDFFEADTQNMTPEEFQRENNLLIVPFSDLCYGEKTVQIRDKEEEYQSANFTIFTFAIEKNEEEYNILVVRDNDREIFDIYESKDAVMKFSIREYKFLAYILADNTVALSGDGEISNTARFIRSEENSSQSGNLSSLRVKDTFFMPLGTSGSYIVCNHEDKQVIAKGKLLKKDGHMYALDINKDAVRARIR